jgi:AcrR family transcriptional regulator
LAAKDLLLREGPEALTHQQVAKAARVGRATVYRHWRRREDLFMDVLTMFAAPPPPVPPDQGAFGMLRAQMQVLRVELWGDLGTLFATLIGRSEWDEQVRVAKRAVVEWSTTIPVQIVAQGLEQGELHSNLPPQLLVSQLIGVMVARRFVFDDPMTAADLDELLYMLLQPTRR